MTMHFRSMTVALGFIALLLPAGFASAATVLLVSGAIHTQIIQGDPNRTPHGAELEAIEAWEGTLAGKGIGHVFGSESFSQGIHGDSTGTAKLFTADGNLFLTEATTRDGLNIIGVAVVSGGTGIYKGAVGTLALTGMFVGPGRLDWVYSGSIELKD